MSPVCDIICSVIVLQTPERPATGGVPAGTPFFICLEEMTLKPFLSYTEQVNHLEQEKHLIIENASFAETTLQRIGYFSLINGYKQLFKNPTTQQYRDNARFEDIVALYALDENLRELFLKYILRIEGHIRSLLSYAFVDKYGCEQVHYLTAQNYTENTALRADVHRLVNVLHKSVTTQSNYPYIEHQRTKHGNVPLWVLTNCLTLGTLSKFYTLLTPDLKVKISKNFDKVNERQLGQFLNVITKFRNVCAHNERLFTYKTVQEIPNMPMHQKLCIEQKGTQYLCGKKDLFAMVIAFRYLLSKEDFLKFKKQLNRILKSYFKTNGSIAEDKILVAMGFPENWSKISSFSK